MNQHSKVVPSPGPGWATLKGPSISGSAAGASISSTSGSRAPNAAAVPSSSTPGQSIEPAPSGPSVQGREKLVASDFTFKPPNALKTSTQISAAASASSSVATESSTASALAALYAGGAAPTLDPSIQRWRDSHRARIHPNQEQKEYLERREKGQEQSTAPLGHKGKGKAKAPNPPGYLDDSSDSGIASSAGPIRNFGVAKKSTSNTRPGSPSGSASGSRRTSLAEQALVKSAREKEDHAPLYVNGLRQIARKSTTSKPAKVHQFDRPLPSNIYNTSSESSSPGSTSDSAPSPTNLESTKEGNKPGPSMRKSKLTPHKSVAGNPPRKSYPPSLSKGKEKAMPPATDDVIVISSDDDDLAAKPINASTPSGVPRDSSRKTSGSKPRNPRDEQRRHTLGGSSDLAAALNEAYKLKSAKPKVVSSSQKPIEDKIIDLTLDDSDDVRWTPTLRIKPPLTSTPLPTRQPAPQPSPPPPTPPIVAPAPALDQIRPKTVAEVKVGPSKPSMTPRRRSVPMVSAPEVSVAPGQSQSARTSPTASPETFILRRPIIPSRRIVRSPESDSSQAAEEREVVEAMIEDIANDSEDVSRDHLAVPSAPASSSNVSSVRASPEVIPPLRRSTRHSSASSHSEVGDYVPLTDAESPPASSPSPEPADEVNEPSYGGFKAFTWEHHKKNLQNFHFKNYSAKDIPTALPDSINRLSEYTRRDAGIRDVFQAYILESICDDEGGAPEIEIVNDIDAEPSPVLEFNYSNRMWYGERVPMPDYSNLKGCDCVGGCDPRSKTCSCAIRQREFLGMDDGCVYDKNGRLKHPRYPIFECNDLCSCDDDCRNRVVQHGRKIQISIKKTAEKGWDNFEKARISTDRVIGIFNGPKRMPRGTFLGIYAGELLTDEEGEKRGHFYNNIGKSYLFDVDFWHLKNGTDPDVEWHNKYTVDAYHAGNFTRFLNHSCDPNARLYACYINEPDVEKPLLVVFSTRDIAPHEEICFNYMGKYLEDEETEDENEDEDEKEQTAGEKRKDPVYIRCRCGARNCTGEVFLP
ncbi:Histone-lysine N-methyltransferase, H3 lysine-9 specific [Leucoagaricus sp. SymC.cos]|nr:Histone-lysine N-methyltransferase, H3 lysine-9 specific [Leucoagaricus sp. SymC.cos]